MLEITTTLPTAAGEYTMLYDHYDSCGPFRSITFRINEEGQITAVHAPNEGRMITEGITRATKEKIRGDFGYNHTYLKRSY